MKICCPSHVPIGRGNKVAGVQRVIYPDFPLDLTGFFSGKHLIQILADKMQDFRNFVVQNCILNFDDEQVYLNFTSPMSRIRKLKQALNPKRCNWSFENPKP